MSPNSILSSSIFVLQHGKTEFEVVQPKFLVERSKETTSATAASVVTSPMPGVCDKILVKVGGSVEANTPVAVIIAMKMEYVLKAPRDGIVKSVSTKLGQNVAKGEVIVKFMDETDNEITAK